MIAQKRVPRAGGVLVILIALLVILIALKFIFSNPEYHIWITFTICIILLHSQSNTYSYYIKT